MPRAWMLSLGGAYIASDIICSLLKSFLINVYNLNANADHACFKFDINSVE